MGGPVTWKCPKGCERAECIHACAERIRLVAGEIEALHWIRLEAARSIAAIDAGSPLRAALASYNRAVLARKAGP